MAGVMYLGNQMVSPAIIQGGEENTVVPVKDGIIGRNYGNGEEVAFQGIKEIADFGMTSLFSGYNIFYEGGPSLPVKVSFPDLEKIGSYGLYYCFEYQPDIKYLFFPSLKPENFLENKHQFDNMFSSFTTNCAVYFPSNMENAIGSWSSLVNGFGGSNTTVYFWIPTEIILNVLQQTASIITNDKISGNLIYGVGSTVRYVVYDSTLNKAFLGVESGCVEGGTPRTVDIDLSTGTYNKITIRVEESLSNITCSWNNLDIPLAEESENVYTVYINPSVGEILTVDIAQSSEHPATSVQITTNGEDIDETIILPEFEDFVQPVLSSNGIIGGDSFAVQNSSNTSDSNVYKAFDGDESTYWTPPSSSSYPMFYNPKGISISSIVVKSTDTSHMVSSVPAMFGGNNGSPYENQINGTVSVSGSTMTFTPTNGGFYKYFVMIIGGSTTKNIAEITITGKVMPDGN